MSDRHGSVELRAINRICTGGVDGAGGHVLDAALCADEADTDDTDWSRTGKAAIGDAADGCAVNRGQTTTRRGKR